MNGLSWVWLKFLDLNSGTESHTSANISAVLKKVCERYTTNASFVSLTTDGAANMMKSHTALVSDEKAVVSEGLRCVSHSIHNLLKPVWNLEIVRRVRAAVTKIRYSNNMMADMKAVNEKQCSLLIDSVVRWNSTLRMLKSFVRWEEKIFNYRETHVSYDSLLKCG